MGGKALQRFGIFTERKNTEEFERIGKEIQRQIRDDYKGILKTKIVTCYHNKADHGDLDLLLKIDKNFSALNEDIKKYIEERFKPKAIHTNGGVYSFDYDNFQIDFIPIRESIWETALVYYSYDPLGNAMGKTFHKMNLSYGWDGLKYKYRNFNGRNSHNITISKDPREIFEFGGFDYDRYLKGFENIEEIFEFIIKSEKFNIETFKMENLRHIDKKRNKKRKSYHAFLEYANKIENCKSYIYKEKSIYIPIIDKAFPNAKLIEKLDKLDEMDRINRKLAEKFNGRIVMEQYPDLNGKELGKALGDFKQFLGGDEDYKAFILGYTNDEIKAKFAEFYEINDILNNII